MATTVTPEQYAKMTKAEDEAYERQRTTIGGKATLTQQQLATVGARVVAGNGQDPVGTVISTISDNTASDRDDDAQMIAALRAYVERKQRKLDILKQWFGIK